MKAAELIYFPNGELHDFEVTYIDHRVPFSSVATATHIVRQSKSVPNALARFGRAVPHHGPIKSVRKVATK